jgi:hypothetical protein
VTTVMIPALPLLQQSPHLTLCGRALDSRSPRPILGDTMAHAIVRTLDYDCERFGLSPSRVFNIALRAKKLDGVVRDFVTRHPDAVVLDLGAGFDTRMLRIVPPPTVTWYDVDFSEVIAARQNLIPSFSNAHGMDADLTDPDWLNAFPADRYRGRWAVGVPHPGGDDRSAEPPHRPLPQRRDRLQRLLQVRIWAAKQYHGTQSIADLIKSPGFDDPREPERWNPRLTPVRESLLTRESEVPLTLRLFTRLAALSTAWSRRGATMLHYRF